MICLGIESTAHTLGIGIMDDKGNVLANEKSSYTTDEGGIHPRKAVEHHVLFYDFVLKRALKSANITLKEVDLIAFSRGPGLGGCLRIGAAAARALATTLNIPIIGVNHCIAHVEIGKQTSGFKDPITLYTSGANTQILALASGRYRVFGETLDTGVGNFLDSFGRALGIGFPAGPKIEEMAAKSKNYIELPYTIKGMDFAFSGLQTKLEQLARAKGVKKASGHSKASEVSKTAGVGASQKPKVFDTSQYIADLCYSCQETVFAILTEATERAISQIGKTEILLTGGVAANKRLASMLATMAKARGCKFAVVPFSLACDNGAMIAWQGIVKHNSIGADAILETQPKQGWRTDDVDVTWL